MGGLIGIPADSQGRLVLPDGGAPPPEPLRADAAFAAESPGLRSLRGHRARRTFRWRDVPVAPKGPEVSADGIKEAMKLTALTTHVEATDGGRMRFELTSRALPLPGHAELRGRTDCWGHLLLSCRLTHYGVIPTGALRTLLGERRVDVTPLAAGQVKAAGEGRRLGVAVRKVDSTAPLGTLRLELGKVTEVGEGGPLLCRAFVEMLGVDPKSAACVAGEVPLFASWTWQEGGGIGWGGHGDEPADGLPPCPLRRSACRGPVCALGVARRPRGDCPSRARTRRLPDGPHDLVAFHGSAARVRGSWRSIRPTRCFICWWTGCLSRSCRRSARST